MYFIVFVVQINQNVLVPYSWVKLNRFLESTVNNGINTNIPFDVFYTLNPEAFQNAIPKLNFPPIIHASRTSIFPNEGWFRCYIRRFKCMYH